MKKVLVACEESQAVTKEFRALGFEAYSCDILPCSGGHPEWHIQGDVFECAINPENSMIITQNGDSHLIFDWDFIVSFQPCTDLTVSGARWFKEKRASGSQYNSIRFFFEMWLISDVCENPIGILNGGDYVKKWFPDLYEEMKQARFPFKPSQIIQPWQFGHGETKSTCLWIKKAPKLNPTNIVDGREQRIWKLPPTEDRAKLRSKTFPGISKAMAEQWGDYILNK